VGPMGTVWDQERTVEGLCGAYGEAVEGVWGLWRGCVRPIGTIWDRGGAVEDLWGLWRVCVGSMGTIWDRGGAMEGM